MNTPALYNVMELYAENAQKAAEARRGWTARSVTLDFMYENIPGLEAADLDTKNYIYDCLLPIISAALERQEAEQKKTIEAYLSRIKADYYRPTATNPAYIVFFDYMAEAGYYRRNNQRRKMLEAFTRRHKLRTDANSDNYTSYFYIYA